MMYFIVGGLVVVSVVLAVVLAVMSIVSYMEWDGGPPCEWVMVREPEDGPPGWHAECGYRVYTSADNPFVQFIIHCPNCERRVRFIQPSPIQK